ncbi:MAG TPA: DAK2 domain-containing protein [Candidatus Limnocylindrales bacterium]|nr:DAK2 domain-containing protein [Candidatus Limnocylindrales bacterium]
MLGAFAAAARNLEQHAAEINALNVYPVPDGDTGSNMVATVRAALAEARRIPPSRVGDMAAALSFGALMGARGNSGVILSQLLRGIGEASAGKESLSGLDLAYAFAEGTRAAYSAVAVPVEGTMLTVARDASEAAVAAAERGGDVGAVLEAAVNAAAASVRRTPTLLEILAQAGVVDAGGQGLYRLLEGAAGHDPAAEETPEHPIPTIAAGPGGVGEIVGPAAGADGGRQFGYETLFIVEARDGDRLDAREIRSRLAALGESVLVAGDEHRVKVHVHGERPDAVIGYGLSLGTLRNISVENLDAQAAEVRDAREMQLADDLARDLPRPVESDGEDAVVSDVRQPAILAVVSGDGLARVFRALGADLLLNGGQAANPSTGELLRVARLARSREVIVLPNNPNVRMAAEQAAAHCPERRIVVIPTRNPVEGIAALLALDPSKDADANAGPMADAARSVPSLLVTEAVRDARVDGRDVRQGQTIVLDPDEGIVAGGPDGPTAIVEAVAHLPLDAELVTVYTGADAKPTETSALVERLRAARPDSEIEVVEGGQAHYRYLISAE